MSVRIQRRRTKGWRMPEGAIYVGRPSRWGNVVSIGEILTSESGFLLTVTPGIAVNIYRTYIFHSVRLDTFLAPLRGHDLACWCPLDQPCHADVLLELANR